MAIRLMLLYLGLCIQLIATANGTEFCGDTFELRDKCANPGTQTAFACLINAGEDVFWAFKPNKTTKPINIARNTEVSTKYNSVYHASVLYVNQTHSCALLTVNIDDIPETVHYECSFGSHQYWADLRLTQLKREALRGSLQVTESQQTDGVTVSITAMVTGVSGIPGLGLTLYVNDRVVKEEPPGSMDCTPASDVNMTHTETLDDGQPVILNVRLAYWHASMEEEKMLSNSTRIIYPHEIYEIRGSVNVINDSNTILISSNIPSMARAINRSLRLYVDKALQRTFDCEEYCNREFFLKDLSVSAKKGCLELILTYYDTSVKKEVKLDKTILTMSDEASSTTGSNTGYILAIVFLSLIVLFLVIYVVYSRTTEKKLCNLPSNCGTQCWRKQDGTGIDESPTVRMSEVRHAEDDGATSPFLSAVSDTNYDAARSTINADVRLVDSGEQRRIQDPMTKDVNDPRNTDEESPDEIEMTKSACKALDFKDEIEDQVTSAVKLIEPCRQLVEFLRNEGSGREHAALIKKFKEAMIHWDNAWEKRTKEMRFALAELKRLCGKAVLVQCDMKHKDWGSLLEDITEWNDRFKVQLPHSGTKQPGTCLTDAEVAGYEAAASTNSQQPEAWTGHNGSNRPHSIARSRSHSPQHECSLAGVATLD